QKLSADTCLRRSGAVQLRPAYGREFSLALNSGKIALAFLREHNRDLQTMRTYEIPGCGAFMLHERTPEVTAIFREGEEAEFFGSYEEMKRKIDRYLADDSARQRIALAGFRKATSGSMSFEARV